MPGQFMEKTAAVRESVVPWDGYQQTGLITYQHLELIQKYAKKVRCVPIGGAYACFYVHVCE